METVIAEPFVSVEVVPLAPDVDGVIRVGNTRVTLDTLVLCFLEGATAEEIAQQYPSVSLADIYYVIGYYLRHTATLQAYLAHRADYRNQMQQSNEARFSPIGIRKRLLVRQSMAQA